MNTDHNSQALWFSDVVQPKLNLLLDLSVGRIAWKDFQAKEFFKVFLADLEVLELDNIPVENCVERIIDGINTLKAHDFKADLAELREVAKMALLPSQFDRSLFLSYWKHYRPFVKKCKNLKDTSIVNAYKVPANLEALVIYILSSPIANQAPVDTTQTSFKIAC